MSLDRCPKCRNVTFKFHPPTSLDAAFVTCYACSEQVDPSWLVCFSETEFDLQFIQPGGPWHLELDGIYDNLQRKYVVIYIAGEGKSGPRCRFEIPKVLSLILENEHTRGWDEARNEIRRKIGL